MVEFVDGVVALDAEMAAMMRANGARTKAEALALIEQHPELWRCDFCSSRGVTMSYPCENMEFGETTIHTTGVGGWAACALCSDLVERGRRDLLAKRSVDVAMEHRPELRADPGFVRRGVNMLHGAFWKGRTGPGVRVDPNFDTDGTTVIEGERRLST